VTTAVVTGASRGIGRAIAIALAERGFELALWARDGAALAEVAAACEARGVRVLTSIVDVTKSDQVDAAAIAVRGALAPVRVIVNNAGIVVRKPTIELTDDEWRRVMAVNCDGTFYVTRAFLSDLVVEGGRIINIASRAGREGTPLLAAYNTAKHGIIGLTRSLAEELRTAKVSVNAVCPGSVDTAMLAEGHPGGSPLMTPDDVARAVVFLAKDAPAQITGSCIDLFG